MATLVPAPTANTFSAGWKETCVHFLSNMMVSGLILSFFLLNLARNVVLAPFLRISMRSCCCCCCGLREIEIERERERKGHLLVRQDVVHKEVLAVAACKQGA